MPNKYEKLDNLVKNGTIKSYSVKTIDEHGNHIEVWNEPGRFRNTQHLFIEFNNGETLCVDTFCSGSMENTHLIFK